MTTDHALLAQLRSIIETVDPVPSDVVDLARASLVWRDPDTALAQLIADSLADAATVRTRRGAGPRLLTFEADRVTIEVEVAEDGDSRRMLGQLVPPARAEITVRWNGGQTAAQADEIGRFSVTSVPAGPVSLWCRLEHSVAAVTTDWVIV